MRLYNLHLKNIGPFNDALMEFICNPEQESQPPVTIITGENGTGKTVVIDAIRQILLGRYSNVERDIIRNNKDFIIAIDLYYGNERETLIQTQEPVSENSGSGAITQLIHIFSQANQHNPDTYKKLSLSSDVKSSINWVVDYWSSGLATDYFQITGLTNPHPFSFLENPLSGIHSNAELTQLICFFDYLRNSESPKEKKAGEFLYSKLKEIIKLSLNNGELAYVARAKLQPVIRQNEMEISLDKLSSGNLYLIQRMVSMLGKMYSLHILQETPVEEICNAPGLLLIDEAENHLHPKWQKTFIGSILKIFPNLQIILTTHSPFIVSSVKNARVYVCESKGDHCIIKDETEEYANMPVEEILLSPLFGETSPFNVEITEWMKKRKKAVKEGNRQLQLEMEQKLKAANPEYFSYFDIDKLLTEITKGKQPDDTH